MNDLLLMCLIAGRRAAIPAALVQSVIEIDQITPIPGAPDFILGLTAMRSQALTVIDCQIALGFGGQEPDSDRRAAVVQVGGHSYALLVEEAYDVGEARSDPIEVPGGFGRGWQMAARGMVETDCGPTLLIDVDVLVAGPVVRAA